VFKKWFTIESILVALDLDKKIKMKVDTLDYTMGEVFLIECKNG